MTVWAGPGGTRRLTAARAVGAALLLAALTVGSYALQLGFGWAASRLTTISDSALLRDRSFPPLPQLPPPVAADGTLGRWRVEAEVTQRRTSPTTDTWAVSAQVTVPPDATALTALRTGDHDADAVAAALLGRVSIHDYGDVTPRSFVVVQPDPLSAAVLRFTAAATVVPRSQRSVSVSEPAYLFANRTVAAYSVRVTAESYDVTAVSVTPARQAPREVRFDRAESFTVGLGEPPPPVPSTAAAASVRVLWVTLLCLVVVAVPYLVLRRPELRRVPAMEPLRRFALSLLLWHGAVRLLTPFSQAESWLRLREQALARAFPAMDIVVLVTVVVAGPWLGARLGRSRRGSGYAVQAAATALTLVLSLLPWAGANRRAVAVAAAGVLVTVAVAAALAHVVRVPAQPVALAVALTALVALVSPATLAGGPLLRALGASLHLAAGVAAVAWPVRAVCELFTGRPLRRAASVALVAVTAALVAPRRFSTLIYPVVLSIDVSTVAVVAAAFTVVAAVRAELAADADSGRAVRLRWLGVAFAATAFFPATALARGLPVVLLTGVALTVCLALPRHLAGTVPATGLPEHATVVAAALRARSADRAAARMRRRLRDKVEAGELRFAEFEERLAEVERVARDERRSVSGTSLEAAAFGSYVGPPWRLARLGALAGLLAGAPWVLLSFDDVLQTQRPFPYPAFSAALDVVQSAGRWTAYGFLFGACYPLVRGRTGVTKGLVLFVTTALPVVVATVVTGHPDLDAWREAAIACSQLFLHFMLLGALAVAYALHVTREQRWTRIFDLHDVRALVAWTTSVAVAFGTALSTAIASGATAFVIGVLQPARSDPTPADTTTQQR